MKNTTRYIFIVSLLMLLGACSEDFLNLPPEDRLTADGFYNNESEISASTASLYGYPWFGFNDKFFWLAGDCMAGNIYYTYDQEGQFYYFSFNEGNSHLSFGWKSLFRVVSYANAVINDMPRIAAENGVSQDIIDQALGEARFVRASAYYFLTEFWGEVPIVENSTELVVSNNMILPRNTRSSLYEFIKRDLEYAAEKLKEIDDPGRVTQWSAKGMLAKLHLTMASDLSDANSASNFQLARDYAQDVIENSGAELMANYHDLFLIKNNNNTESLFAMQWMKGGYAIGNSHNANWARSSLIADQQWGGGKGCTYDLQQDFEEGDLRRRSIYMTLGDYYPEMNIAEGGYTYYFETKDPNNPNNNIESPNEVLNHLKKYVVGSSADNDGQVGTDQDAGDNQYILRLADIYLIYAEATLGAAASTSDATALSYFNTVRERAGLEAKESITFMDILIERRIEFALESLFWFDIKRYYYRNSTEALAYLNAQERHYIYRRIDGDNDANSWDSYELDVTGTPVTVFESQMYLPIPASEVLVNPLLDEPAVEYDFE
jgi:starch-binding outer membrane protein, SusD/RagB family